MQMMGWEVGDSAPRVYANEGGRWFAYMQMKGGKAMRSSGHQGALFAVLQPRSRALPPPTAAAKGPKTAKIGQKTAKIGQKRTPNHKISILEGGGRGGKREKTGNGGHVWGQKGRKRAKENRFGCAPIAASFCLLSPPFPPPFSPHFPSLPHRVGTAGVPPNPPHPHEGEPGGVLLPLLALFWGDVGGGGGDYHSHLLRGCVAFMPFVCAPQRHPDPPHITQTPPHHPDPPTTPRPPQVTQTPPHITQTPPAHPDPPLRSPRPPHLTQTPPQLTRDPPHSPMVGVPHLSERLRGVAFAFLPYFRRRPHPSIHPFPPLGPPPPK